MLTEQVNRIIELYTIHEKSPYQIADELNTYPNKIRNVLKQHGVKLRNKSEAQKNYLEKGGDHPTKGKPRTKEEKAKIGRSVHEQWNELSKEEKDRRIAANKKLWEEMSPEERQNMQKKAHDAIRRTAKEGSRLEKGIHNALVKDGYRTVFHYDGVLYGEQLELDIYLPETKIVIEIDGISHYEPIWGEESLAKQQTSDEKKNGLLISKNIYVIRLINYAKSLSETKITNAYNLIKKSIKEIESEQNKMPRVIYIPFDKED